MVTLAPKYYKDFHCIADKCRHSCCIGWEIDIDEDTYKAYMSHGTPLEARFQKSICHGDNPHFILDEKERCPFLNSKNLCDIYTEMGEASLCQICTDHPRFRNFYSSATEVGLGLCCEEACRIILGNNDCFGFDVIDGNNVDVTFTDDEANFFELRDMIVKKLCNRENSIDERFNDVWRLLGISVNISSLKKLFDGLEYMEHDVSAMISETFCGLERYLEQLAVYFIFRHFSGSLDDGLFAERAVFAYVGVKAVSAMCKSDDFNEICENARIYSSEIEYSEENVDEILKRVGDYIEISF